MTSHKGQSSEQLTDRVTDEHGLSNGAFYNSSNTLGSSNILSNDELQLKDTRNSSNIRSSADGSVVIQLGLVGSDEKNHVTPDHVMSERSSEEFEDLDDDHVTGCAASVLRVQQLLRTSWNRNRRWVVGCVYAAVLVAVTAGVVYGTVRDPSRSPAPLTLLALLYLYLLHRLVSHLLQCGKKRSISGYLKAVISKMADSSCYKSCSHLIKPTVAVLSLTTILTLSLLYNYKRPEHLMSLVGLVLLLLVSYLTSINPARVRWQPVIGGLSLQFLLGVVILRTDIGLSVFKFIGEQMNVFFSYTNAGSEFVFGEAFTHHYFAMAVMPIVIFFSSFISLLYYLGVMQFLIKHIGSVLQFTLDTTSGESTCAAGNIFIGQTEAPLLISPIIHALTLSELHAVMVGGFATIAGSVMATYIVFGVEANHLLSASVMSSCAALCVAKLNYPETQRSKTVAADIQLSNSTDSNVIDALSSGACTALKLAANIIVMLISFLAMLSFINAILQFIGDFLGTPEPLTFEYICGYVLAPLAYVIGVDWADSRTVGELLGTKTFLNEFVAYIRLADLITNKQIYDTFVLAHGQNASFVHAGRDLILSAPGVNQTVLINGIISERSSVICTYALCGFANIGSVGVMLAGLGSLAPRRRTAISQLVVRAMIMGNIACFMTACIAGLTVMDKQDTV